MEQLELRAFRDQGLPFRISLEAVNKAVGLVALSLPFALLLIGKATVACDEIDSISHYYFTLLGGDILVGSLFLIGVLLAFFYKMPKPVDGYLGHGIWDIRLARFAGLCAFGIAFAPTAGAGCEEFAGSAARLFADWSQTTEADITPPVFGHDFWGTLGVDSKILGATHYVAALGMFSVLAYYSLVVFRRPQSATSLDDDGSQDTKKRTRNNYYLVFGLLIVLAIAALAVKFLAFKEGSDGLRWWNEKNLTFWFEALALVAFGLSWSLKGRVFDWFRDTNEENPRLYHGRTA